MPTPLEFFESKINPEDGAFTSAVLFITKREEMALFYLGYVEWLATHRSGGLPSMDPAQVARENIGFQFLEGMDEDTARLWNSVTGAYHPVFGMRRPTTAEAVHEGIAVGSNMKAMQDLQAQVDAQRDPTQSPKI